MTTFFQFETFVILLTVTLVVALISRQLRVPYTLALVVVGQIIGFSHIVPGLRLDPEVVLILFLPALLFEGAWNVKVAVLRENWLPVLLLAVPGLLISIAVVAAVLHWLVGFDWLLALLIGAIISPTDPIAVIALLRSLGMSERLRTIIEGESLFNDGIGAAAYEIILALLLVAYHLPGAGPHLSVSETILDSAWLIVGGPLIGLIIGMMVGYLLRFIDDHLFEVSVTLAVAYGAYLVGVALHTSGLLAVVTAGLTMGSFGRRVGMSQNTSERADDVWEFIGYVANSLLFLLLGVQIGATNFLSALPAIGWAVLGVLIGRAGMVYGLLGAYNWFVGWLAQREKARTHQNVMRPAGFAPIPRLWRPLFLFSGLRGALSLALVLSLPVDIPSFSLLEEIVYGVVLVTLVGQGLGLRVLLPRWQKSDEE